MLDSANILSGSGASACARQEEASRVEKSTKTTVARRGTERTSATMATTEQVQEALQQLQLQVEQTRAKTAEQELENASTQTLVTTKGKGKKETEEQKTRRWRRSRKETTPVRTKEEGARVQRTVLSLFATAETNEQLKNEEKRKQPGNGTQEPKKTKQPGSGTQEPKKKTDREWDPRTHEQTARDRDPRTRGEEKTAQVGTLAVEVDKTKSELFEAEKSMLADKELASKSSGRGVRVGGAPEGQSKESWYHQNYRRDTKNSIEDMEISQ